MKSLLLLLALAGCATPESAPARAETDGEPRVYEIQGQPGTKAYLVIFGGPMRVKTHQAVEEE